MSDDPLGVGNVWEMPKTNGCFIFGQSHLSEANACDREDEKKLCFHGNVSVTEIRVSADIRANISPCGYLAASFSTE